MDLTTLLQADYLDILYDNRNKSYGGYELRKHYNQRLGKAGAFLALSVGLLIWLSFFIAHQAPAVRTYTTVVAPKLIDITPPPPKIIPKVIRETTPPPPPAHVKTTLFTQPVIDPTDHVPDDKLMTENKRIGDAHPGLTVAEGDSLDAGVVAVKGNGTGVVTQPKSNEPVRYVPQMPQFAGDMDAYIGSHLKYPDAARETNISGTALIEFVVNEDGSVSNASIVRNPGGGCGEEALRMVRSMPKWKPGKQNGVAVKVLFTLPIRFVLQ